MTAKTKADEKQLLIADNVRELIRCIDGQPGRAKQIAEELLTLLPAE